MEWLKLAILLVICILLLGWLRARRIKNQNKQMGMGWGLAFLTACRLISSKDKNEE